MSAASIPGGGAVREPGPDRLADQPRHVEVTGAPPISMSSFVGRERELDEIRPVFREGARLVTLVGIGGIGKTRLALQLGVSASNEGWATVYFVGLASLTNPGLVDGGGVPARGNGPAGAGQLRACPGGSSACSRGAVAGEAASDAARLFAHRASYVRPRFELSEDVAGAVETIVCRVDGIPLAIELAAARTPSPSTLPPRRREIHRCAGRRRHRGLHRDHDVRDHAVDSHRPWPQRPGPSLTTTHQDDPAQVLSVNGSSGCG